MATSILPRVDATLGDEREPGSSIVKLRGQIFLERYAAHLEPTPGARDLLERLHALDILRVVATLREEGRESGRPSSLRPVSPI